jgi:hypothetical protein
MTKSDKTIDLNRHSQMAPQAGSVSVSLRSVRPVLMYITAQGYDTNEVLRGEGVNPTLLSDPEARLPHTAGDSTVAGSWPDHEQPRPGSPRGEGNPARSIWSVRVCAADKC